MENNLWLVRFIRRSPVSLLLFLVLPVVFIVSSILHLRLPFNVSTSVMLANNICLVAVLGIRLQYYLSRLPRPIRYGSERPGRAASLEVSRPLASAREGLSAAGFRFEDGGSYGEKRDLGFLGTTLLIGGLFLLLMVGTWDNLRQFSGTAIKGPGAALDLSQSGKYYHLISGPFASPAGLPLLKVTKQIFPGDSKYPLGASELRLYAKDGKFLDQAFIDANQGPHRFGGYDYFVGRLLADIQLAIKTNGSFDNNVFDEAVKLMPLYDKRVGNFTLCGNFTTPAGDDGQAFLDPVRNQFRITLSHQGKPLIDTDYQFQAYREKQAGNYVVSVVGMGTWTEIHVVRPRHMALIVAGGILAALGLLMRLAFRSQRVWLAEGGSGCRAQFVGDAARKVLELEAH